MNSEVHASCMMPVRGASAAVFHRIWHCNQSQDQLEKCVGPAVCGASGAWDQRCVGPAVHEASGEWGQR